MLMLTVTCVDEGTLEGKVVALCIELRLIIKPAAESLNLASYDED